MWTAFQSFILRHNNNNDNNNNSNDNKNNKTINKKLVCLFVCCCCFLSLEYNESIYMTFGFCVPCRISRLTDELKKTRRKMEDYKTR